MTACRSRTQGRGSSWSIDSGCSTIAWMICCRSRKRWCSQRIASAAEKNVDFVVETLKNFGVPFLAHVVGECTDKPNLKQIFSKHSEYSILITEYVERCFGYEGFFTKSNVAELTRAAGEDERYHHGNVFD